MKNFLDKYQKAFCAETSNRIRLLAPAGCGKTHSLLWRCLYQAKHSESRNNRFLVFTFTRGAAIELRKRLQEQPDFEKIRKNIKITTLNAWGWNYVRKDAINPKLVTTDKEQINQILNVLQPEWGNHQILRDKLTHSRKKYKTAKDLFEVIDKLKTLGFRHDYKKVNSVKEHIKFLMNSGLKIHWDAFVNKLENMELFSTEDSVDKLFESVIYKFWCDAVIQTNNRAFYTLEDQNTGQ